MTEISKMEARDNRNRRPRFGESPTKISPEPILCGPATSGSLR
jgi:hypothetical protein